MAKKLITVDPRTNSSGPVRLETLATWRSGYAAACKAVYTGSIPVVASLEERSLGRAFCINAAHGG